MRVLMIAALGLVFSQCALADQASGFYAGGGVGRISIKGLDGSTTGFKAFIGENFNRFVGVEAAYVDAGDSSVAIYDPYYGVTAYADETLRAAQLSLLGRIPLSPYFSLFGRVDGIYWRDDLNSGGYDPYGYGYGYTQSNSGTAFGWGAGGEASFGRFAVRAEFEQANIDSDTYRLVSGSVIYRF